MSKSALRVVVVGAGVAGLSAACGLRQCGYHVTVIERGAAPTLPTGDWQARVSAFSPASIDFLTDVGAWPKGSERLRPYRDMSIWTDGAFDRVQFSADELGYTALGAIAENSLIQTQLWVQAETLGVDLRANTEWNELASSEAAVALTLNDGSVVDADWLVAADGAQSLVRETLGVAQNGWSYEQKAIVCTVNWSARNNSNSAISDIGRTAAQRFMKSGPLALLPLSEAQSSLVWSLETELCADMLLLDDSAFKAALNDAIGSELSASVLSVGKRFSFPLRLAQASRYVEGRCVLIGDAAHNIHPLAGQGLNLGILDARDLVATFSAATANASGVNLSAWQRKRRAKTAEMMALTDALYRVYRVGQQYKAGSAAGFLRYATANVSRGLLSAGMAFAGGSALLRQQLARIAVDSDR